MKIFQKLVVGKNKTFDIRKRNFYRILTKWFIRMYCMLNGICNLKQALKLALQSIPITYIDKLIGNMTKRVGQVIGAKCITDMKRLEWIRYIRFIESFISLHRTDGWAVFAGLTIGNQVNYAEIIQRIMTTISCK